MLTVPTLIAVLWMTAFGGTALSQYLDGGYTAALEPER